MGFALNRWDRPSKNKGYEGCLRGKGEEWTSHERRIRRIKVKDSTARRSMVIPNEFMMRMRKMWLNKSAGDVWKSFLLWNTKPSCRNTRISGKNMCYGVAPSSMRSVCKPLTVLPELAKGFLISDFGFKGEYNMHPKANPCARVHTRGDTSHLKFWYIVLANYAFSIENGEREMISIRRWLRYVEWISPCFVLLLWAENHLS